MLPISGYGCESETNKSCCKKQKTEKAEKKYCCNKHSEGKDNSCEGKCGHSNCTSSASVNFSIISSYEINLKNNTYDFWEEKSKFYHLKTSLSSGFYSIWLTPKIG